MAPDRRCISMTINDDQIADILTQITLKCLLLCFLSKQINNSNTFSFCLINQFSGPIEKVVCCGVVLRPRYQEVHAMPSLSLFPMNEYKLVAFPPFSYLPHPVFLCVQ